jgi:hypothetical protein
VRRLVEHFLNNLRRFERGEPLLDGSSEYAGGAALHAPPRRRCPIRCTTHALPVELRVDAIALG